MGSAENQLYDLEQVAFPSLGLSFPIWADLALCHLPSVDSLCLSPTLEQPLSSRTAGNAHLTGWPVL